MVRGGGGGGGAFFVYIYLKPEGFIGYTDINPPGPQKDPLLVVEAFSDVHKCNSVNGHQYTCFGSIEIVFHNVRT